MPSIQPAKRRKVSDEALDLSVDEIDVTAETLVAIAQSTALQRSKQVKPIKAAIHSYLRATGAGASSSLTQRISEALADARWVDARCLLAEFKIRGEKAKLGTLQRWVRDVDAADAGAGVDQQVFMTLDAILRATAGAEDNDPLHQCPNVSFQPVSGLDVRQSVLDGTIFEGRQEELAKNFAVVEVTPALERKPPNQYDAVIYTSLKPLVSGLHAKTVRHNVDSVPGAFVLQNLLTHDECRAIVRGGESVGFSPDLAIAGSATQQVSILAHNFYYFADQNTLEAIYQRALPFLPAVLEGCQVRGLNARFRVYRYVPGAVYRPHIDGAWARSGLDLTKPEGEQYLLNDTRDGAQLSRLTFLIYLNDDFEEGYTTFFVPGHKLNCVRVEPRMGSVLVFPHGESLNALLHEGSGVQKGAKYVIRTDVLYDLGNSKK
ncbi:hypothetical protein BCR37DRAFT_393063 [Protomyces lactucae-debilis]|uniref:Fe2OG dioxygenase domain-containing protein n=1 Tax=Protomyces lactucae-debilis TaxID=2754530 RepID=A0A1Y2FDL2_PROLT|nr:uncharacterized protein BCR37DRAFT_393063 [Protomyces lactucae-debilis]ORY82020.1 hypothetical protein BCR37DRAFT_393063 [Protomyces lactucae-debilis]